MDGNAGPYKVTWRNTDRRGFVKLGNVRTVPTEELVCREDFRIVIDYPWDDLGFSVEDDRQKAANVKKQRGNQFTVCWLPRHFTADEVAVVTEVAAARYLMSSEGQEELLVNLGAADKATVEDRAKAHEQQMRNRLLGILAAAYRDNGECYPLQSDVTVDTKSFPELKDVLQHIAIRLMDRRWPMHPDFLVKPDRRKLETLLKWTVSASDAQGHSVHFDDATDVLRKVASRSRWWGSGRPGPS